MSRRAHKPDPVLRKQVEAMGACGIPEIEIAAIIGIDPKTLRKWYRHELDHAASKANAQVAGFLFNSAKSLEGACDRSQTRRSGRYVRLGQMLGCGT
jgi:hypothetical protein